MARRRNRKGRFTKGGGTHRRRSRAATHTARRRRRTTFAPVRVYRRRYRRNPGGGFGLGKLGGLIPPVKRIAFGVAGSVGTRLIPNLVGQYLPIPVGGPAGLGVQLAAAIFGGMLVGRFAGKQAGEDFAFGGVLAVADKAISEYGPAMGLPVGAYLQPEVSAYLGPGATVPALSGVGDLFDDTYMTAGMGSADLPSRLNPLNRL